MKTAAGPFCHPLLAFACVLVLLQGCGPRPPQEDLLVLTTLPPATREEFADGFSRWYRELTGTTVTVRWLTAQGTAEAIDGIRSRNTSGTTAGIDLFFGGGGDAPFERLSAEGLLAEHNLADSLLARLPSRTGTVALRDSRWHAAALRSPVLRYNKRLLDRNALPAPRSLADLAHRSVQGWVAMGDPRSCGAVHLLYEMIVQSYGWDRGWDIITRMGANTRAFSPDESAITKKVALGQAACGVVLDHGTGIKHRVSHQPGLVRPFGGGMSIVDGIAVLQGSPRPQRARSFIHYVLGEGQSLWMLAPGVPGGPQPTPLQHCALDTSRYSLPASLRTVYENPGESLAENTYDHHRAALRWDILGDIVAAFIINPHNDLTRCWHEISRRGLTPQEYAPYLRLELSQREVDLLAPHWSDPSFASQRVRLMSLWTRRARERYTALFNHWRNTELTDPRSLHQMGNDAAPLSTRGSLPR